MGYLFCCMRQLLSVREGQGGLGNIHEDEVSLEGMVVRLEF